MPRATSGWLGWRVEARGRCSRMSAAMWLSRLAPVRPPITTATMLRPPVRTDVTRLNPDARMKPVFDAVDAGHASQEAVMIADRLAAIVELAGAEIAVVARKMLTHREVRGWPCRVLS